VFERHPYSLSDKEDQWDKNEKRVREKTEHWKVRPEGLICPVREKKCADCSGHDKDQRYLCKERTDLTACKCCRKIYEDPEIAKVKRQKI
jgi:hypothetical protein